MRILNCELKTLKNEIFDFLYIIQEGIINPGIFNHIEYSIGSVILKIIDKNKRGKRMIYITSKQQGIIIKIESGIKSSDIE